MKGEDLYYKGFNKAGVKAFTYKAFIKAHSHMKGVDLDDVYAKSGGKVPSKKKND